MCVTNGPENCFPPKCPENGVGARRLGTNMTHMLNDFINGGHTDGSTDIGGLSVSNPVIVYDPLLDPDKDKKMKWNAVLNDPQNKAKIDSLLTVTKGMDKPRFHSYKKDKSYLYKSSDHIHQVKHSMTHSL